MISLKEMDLQELEAWVLDEGEPAYRARQIFAALHQQKIEGMENITTLPHSLRRRWEGALGPAPLDQKETFSSRDGTHKFLFALADGEQIETVWIPHLHHNSLCISTQVGCAMGCGFCASTTQGLKRNLTVAELLEQVYWVERNLSLSITHLLFMGMGEPLANLEGVVQAVEILNHPLGRNISQRRMVISSCGLVPEMNRLAEEDLQVVLSISLHAPRDELRNRLMPINRRYPLQELLAACQNYSGRTGRRMTFEYILIKGWNDSLQEARELSHLLEGFPAHVNLIPCNPCRGNFSPPPVRQIKAFFEELVRRGCSVTIRRPRGQDILAACGQLRRAVGNYF